MNFLSVYIDTIGPAEVTELDGIHFSCCAFVRIKIDGKDLLRQKEFESTCVYFAELERSCLGTGQYLVFTCLCGIADDAGWTEIEVKHLDDSVMWSFERETEIQYVFSASQDKVSIESCRKDIDALGTAIALEPQNVEFPE